MSMSKVNLYSTFSWQTSNALNDTAPQKNDTHFKSLGNVAVGVVRDSRKFLVHCAATGWAKKVSLIIFCNNFVYCKPIFIIFGTYTL